MLNSGALSVDNVKEAEHDKKMVFVELI